MTRLKVLVFVESDVVIRHFLDSGVLAHLALRHDVQLVLPPDGYRRVRSSPPAGTWGLPLTRIAIPETRRHQWRRMFFVDQARLRSGSDWADIRRAWRIMIGWKATLQMTVYALPVIRQVVLAAMRYRLTRTPASQLDDLIAIQHPDVIIHPSTFDGYFINDLIASAQRTKIPVALLMNSWDNPTLKRAAVGVPAAVAVWGEQSRRHAHRFMAVPESHIHVLGAAQFDVYRDSPAEDRDTICREHDIDPARRILMYAGSSKGNREHLHLQWLNDAIERGELGPTTVLYRPHPFGLESAYAKQIIAATPANVRIEISMRPMLERIADGEDCGFFMTPYARTHALLTAVDALISPLSTIIVEAGLHAKPVLCFIPAEEDIDSIWGELRNLLHFRDLFDNPGVATARSHDDFLPQVRRLMTKVGDPDHAAFVRREMEFFARFPPQRFGDGLVSMVESLCAKAPA